MKQFVLPMFFVFFTCSTFAQVGNVQLNEQVEFLFLDSVFSDPTFHTAVRPYRKDQVKGYAQRMNQLSLNVDTRRWNWFYNTNWGGFNIGKKRVYVNPIFSSEVGPIFTRAFGYENDRDQTIQEVQLGVNAKTDLAKNLSIDLSFVFMNWTAPRYLLSWVDSTEVIPHFGHYKNNDKYSTAAYNLIGEISYSPSKFINLQVGRGKNFLGDGYRSLQLSDNAPFYNYVKASLDIGKVKYVFLLNQLSDINPYTEEKYSPKYSVTHFLSYNVTKWLNLNFFETVTQQATDSVGSRGLDVNYLNPVLFFRPAEFNVGSPDNAMLGAGGKIRFSSVFQLYGHFIIDEFILSEMRQNRGFWGNKYGMQMGFKLFEPFRFKGFYFQGEYNFVRPYTYSHDYGRECYGHLHYPLAHPLGANFTEALAILRYRNKRFGASFKLVFSKKGLDTEEMNYGGDIYKDYETRTVPEETKIEVPNWEGENDFGHNLLQGLKTTIRYSEYKIYFILNHRLNLSVEAGISFRKSSNSEGSQDYTYGFFGIRTYLYNNLSDY